MRCRVDNKRGQLCRRRKSGGGSGSNAKIGTVNCLQSNDKIEMQISCLIGQASGQRPAGDFKDEPPKANLDQWWQFAADSSSRQSCTHAKPNGNKRRQTALPAINYLLGMPLATRHNLSQLEKKVWLLLSDLAAAFFHWDKLYVSGLPP